MSDEIKQLEIKAAKLRNELYETKNLITKLTNAQCAAQCAAQVGDIVAFNGKEFRVSGHMSLGWLLGSKRNKDGSWNKRTQTIYNGWKLLEKASL